MGKSMFCLVALLAVLTTALAEEMYSDAFDHIDVEHILVNDELRNQYYMCFMETGPCVTEDQKYFKVHAAEVFVTKCRRCTDKQKDNLAKVVEWYTKNQPEEWNNIVQKLLEDAKKLNITPEL